MVYRWTRIGIFYCYFPLRLDLCGMLFHDSFQSLGYNDISKAIAIANESQTFIPYLQQATLPMYFWKFSGNS